MIYDNLKKDINTCLKQKLSAEVTTLRTWDAQVQLIAKESKKEITDELVLGVFIKEMKKLRDSLEMFTKGDRKDLIQKAEKEIDLLKEYLPEEMSDEDLATIVNGAIAQTDAQSIKDMGKVMPIVMKETKGKADGKKVSSMVRERLSNALNNNICAFNKCGKPSLPKKRVCEDHIDVIF